MLVVVFDKEWSERQGTSCSATFPRQVNRTLSWKLKNEERTSAKGSDWIRAKARFGTVLNVGGLPLALTPSGRADSVRMTDREYDVPNGPEGTLFHLRIRQET